MLFTFTRLSNKDEQRSFLRQIEAEPRGPLRVTAELQREADELLIRAARERAMHFQREQPSQEDLRFAFAENPALARVSRGDISSPSIAEVS